MKLFRPAIFLPLLFATSLFAQSDIYVTKDGPPTTTAGSNIVYTITVGDVGPDATSPAVNMTDVLPAGLTFVSLSQSGPDTFVCSTPSFGTNGTVSCDAASMNLNDVQTFTLTVAVPPDAAADTLYLNTATVSSSNDNNNENDSSTVGTTTPSNSADVAITKSGPTAAAPDTDVTYTITLTNLGPADAQSVSWTDTLPNSVPNGSPMTFVSFNQTSGPTFNCGSPSTTVTCTLQTFPAGSTATFQFVGHIPPSTSGKTYTNVASQTTSNDPNPENDSSATSLTVSSTDVGVVKSAPATGNAGGTFAYTITLTNGGPDTAVNASFTDVLSSYETLISVVQNNGPTATCIPGTPPPGVTFPPGETVQCTIPAFGNGQSAQFTITVAVSPSTPKGTVITNTATANTESFDSNPNNNTSSASTTISASADLAVVKTAPASVTAGTSMSYGITVTNNGPADATSVSLSDVLPAGTTFVSLQQNSGPAFNCTTGATVTCSIGTLTTGSSAAFTLTVAVSSGATGTISNTANVASTTPDGNTANNSSTAPTTVTTSADLSVVKTGPFGPVATGFNVVYNISVANSGPSDAASVTLTDALPAGTTFVSMNQTSGPAFNCSGTTTVTCTIGTLVNGATATFQLTVQNGVTAGNTLSNTATIASTTSDPNPANNSSTTSTTVVATIPLLSPSMLLLLALALSIVSGVTMIRRT